MRQTAGINNIRNFSLREVTDRKGGVPAPSAAPSGTISLASVEVTVRSARQFSFEFLVAFGLAFITYSSGGLAFSKGQPLDLSFSLEKETITLHEPVIVRLRAVNKSNQPAGLDLGFNREGNLRFLIQAPGKEPFRVAPRLDEGLSRYGAAMVAAGQTYTQDILLSALYAFPAKGNYLIQAELSHGGPSGREDQPAAFKSQKMALHVLSRNPSKLRRVCADLAEKMMSGDAESALESATALSYVDDLVAVPYLERAATRGPFKVVIRHTAIDGLARLALTWGKMKVFSLLPQMDSRIEAEISAAMRTVPRSANSPSP